MDTHYGFYFNWLRSLLTDFGDQWWYLDMREHATLMWEVREALGDATWNISDVTPSRTEL